MSIGILINETLDTLEPIVNEVIEILKTCAPTINKFDNVLEAFFDYVFPKVFFEIPLVMKNILLRFG